jgi:aconitate hydratase
VPLSLAKQVLASHQVGGSLEPGKEIQIRVDQTLLQDATGTMACLQFEQLHVDRVKVPFAVVYVDHNILQIDFKNPDDHRFLQTFGARHGIWFSRPGNGICHYLHLERFARPGQTLLGADSHTTTAGALGMIAIGAGGLDVAVAMAGHPFAMETPRVVEVRLEGRLSDWVSAKDIILELLRRRTVRGGLGRIFEFTGPGVETLSATERATICNMIAELGATTGIFPSDRETEAWLRQQDRLDQFKPMAAEPGAAYDEQEVIELGKLVPLVARPHSPGNVVPVEEIAGLEVAQVCVGSSVNSSYEDLATVAAVLRGKSVHPRLAMTVTPGSRQILDTIAATGVYRDLLASGARMLEPACGPCVGMGQAPPSGAVSVRTFNRNFPGRSGTEDDNVYLVSPATAAASALKGVLTDPRTLGPKPTFSLAPHNPEIDDRHILAPPPPEQAQKIEVLRGPNIKPPPEHRPIPANLEGRILIVVGDDISTGDMAPDGAVVMAYRSNVPAIAEFTFQHQDPKFPARAREWGGGFVVGGSNYGQGSSREHAALAPLQLGVRAVIAKSFARIHRRNLIAQGIVPLTFENPDDYLLAAQGDTWKIPAIREAIGRGDERVKAHIEEKNRDIFLKTGFSERERNVLLAGGLLATLRQGGEVLSAGTVVSGHSER